MLATWKTGCWGLEPSHKLRHAPAVSDVGVDGGVWQVEPGPEMTGGKLRGVVGGEGVGVQDSSVEEDCSDGMSLPVLLSELRNDLRRSRLVAVPPPRWRTEQETA